jgi:pyridoxal phosphate enzyme (YggS family)
MTNIEQNIAFVRARIQQTCHKAGRNSNEVTLLAVSKTMSPEVVKAAIVAGQRDFGENYIAEGIEKIRALAHETQQHGLQWHCIGPVQSNKTRLVAQHFDWVHTLDRLKIAERLNEQRLENVKRLQVCIQVNIDNSATKSGVAPAEVLALAQEIAKLPRLELRGIMAIPDPTQGSENTIENGIENRVEITINNIANKSIYAMANSLFLQLRSIHSTVDTLSIGMSADLEPAILSGSTMVRVGSAIFGSRG